MSSSTPCSNVSQLMRHPLFLLSIYSLYIMTNIHITQSAGDVVPPTNEQNNNSHSENVGNLPNDTTPEADPYSYYNLFDFVWNTKESEFRFVIPSNGMQCFYQELENESSAYISFEVLQGTEKTISLMVQHSNKTDIYTERDKSEGTKEFFIEKNDTLSFCFFNFGRLRSSRKVHFYFVSMSRKKETKKSNKPADAESSSNVRDSIASLATSSFKVMEAQALSRLRASKDLQLAKDNASYVQTWAVFHVCIFIAASVLQVAFVRYLFGQPFTVQPVKMRA